MKKWLAVASLLTVAVLALVAVAPALAADGTSSWTGWITDSHCGKGGANAKHTKACVEKCAKDGQVVFFNEADQKIYSLDKGTEALEFVGVKVKVTGTVEGDTIKVASFEKAV